MSGGAVDVLFCGGTADVDVMFGHGRRHAIKYIKQTPNFRYSTSQRDSEKMYSGQVHTS